MKLPSTHLVLFIVALPFAVRPAFAAEPSPAKPAKPAAQVDATPTIDGEEVPVVATARASGPIGRDFRDPAIQEVIRSEQAFQKRFPELRGKSVLRQLKVERIDFEQHLLVFITAGTRNTGGYSVAVTKVIVNKEDKKMQVLYRINRPDGVVTNAITHPGVVALLPKFAGEVIFTNNAPKVQLRPGVKGIPLQLPGRSIDLPMTAPRRQTNGRWRQAN